MVTDQAGEGRNGAIDDVGCETAKDPDRAARCEAPTVRLYIGPGESQIDASSNAAY